MTIRESEVSKYLEEYRTLLREVQQASEFGRFTLEDLHFEISDFYTHTYSICSKIADVKSLPVEQLRVMRLLFQQWIDAEKNQHPNLAKTTFNLLLEQAKAENSGVIPTSFPHTDEIPNLVIRCYRIALEIKKHYEYFLGCLKQTWEFLDEVTRPYHSPVAIESLREQFSQQQTSNMREYLTVSETADLMKCSAKSVYRAIGDGTLKADRVGNKRYRILRLHVEMYLAGRPTLIE